MSSRGDDLEFRALRRRGESLNNSLDQQADRMGSGTVKAVFKVISLGPSVFYLPTYYATNRVIPSGMEKEGAVPSFTTVPDVTLVMVIGSRIPAVGDYLAARLINGRWIAQTRGSYIWGHILTGCGCGSILIPDTIYMRVASPQTAHATLNDSYLYFPVVPSSLRFQTRPADTVPTGTTVINYSPAYYSDAKYPAYLYAGSWYLNGTIRFYMYCDPGSLRYMVGLIYTGDAPQSLDGSSNYTGNFSGLISFLALAGGNPCLPFTMTIGAAPNLQIGKLGITLSTTASDSPPGLPIVMPPAPPKPAVAAPVMPRFS